MSARDHQDRTQIFINGRFLSQRLSGIQRYASETLFALDELITQGAVRPDWRFTVLAPAGTPAPALRNIAFREVGRLKGHAWEQVSLVRAAQGGLLLSFGPTGPLLKKSQIVTMHDAAVVAVPEAYSWQFRAFYRLALPILARRSAAIMTVSEFAKREVIANFGAPPERTHVSGEGWQHISRFDADPRVLEKHGLRSKRYVLAVGNLSPHKNLAVIGEAVKLLKGADYDVVVAGGMDARVFGGGGDAPDRPSTVKLLGRVSDAELRSLYEHAGVFVFPSLYEGFGIPLLEAIAFQCPVISSSAAALPEVGGAGAKYFAPRDAAALARAIDSVMAAEHERNQLIAVGQDQLARYSWHATALSHVAALEAALGTAVSARAARAA
jgi:glycosyltransferase involved in cell wall biosynthesis